MWPKLQVTLVCKPTRTLKALLDAGEIDLTLTTEAEPGEEVLAADPLVWVGAVGGRAHFNTPLALASDSEECTFRKASTAALAAIGRDWRMICSTGDTAPTLALLQADLAVAVLMRRSVPAFLNIIMDDALPRLPTYYVNLIAPATGARGAAAEMVRHLREGFAMLPADGAPALGDVSAKMADAVW